MLFDPDQTVQARVARLDPANCDVVRLTGISEDTIRPWSQVWHAIPCPLAVPLSVSTGRAIAQAAPFGRNACRGWPVTAERVQMSPVGIFTAADIAVTSVPVALSSVATCAVWLGKVRTLAAARVPLRRAYRRLDAARPCLATTTGRRGPVPATASP